MTHDLGAQRIVTVLFINEERNEDGSWAYIDQWRFERKA